jgi:integrase
MSPTDRPSVERAAAVLTDRAVQALKPQPDRRVVRIDGTVPGLEIRVTSTGQKTWSLRYRVGRRCRRAMLGTYPVVGVAVARKKAKQALARLDADGTDPAAAKRDARTRETFGELAADYLTHAKKKKKSWAQDALVLDTILLPKWRHRVVRDLGRRDVKELLSAIVDGRHRRDAKPAPIMANRTQALISTMFNYAVREEWIPFNPAARIEKQPEGSRDRVLTEDELRALWTALEGAKVVRRVTDAAPGPAISPMIAIGLQVLLLTAQRPGEVFSMRWVDVDVDAGSWVIPAAMAKNKQAHRVPLVPRVVELVRAALAIGPTDNRHVFGGIKGGSVAARAVKAMAKLRRADAIDFDVHRHDLRRTAATHMAAAGVPRTTIAYVLNHVDRGSRATQVYDRFEHDVEKRVALETWARRLDGILTATAPAAVLPFTRP